MRKSCGATVDRRPSQELLDVGVGRLGLAQDLSLALALAVAVAERVREDAEEPRLAVGARLERIEEPVGAEHRVLDQVLGIAFVPGHPQRRRIQRRHVGHRFAFEIGFRGTALEKRHER
jgi:hypothetical protein